MKLILLLVACLYTSLPFNVSEIPALNDTGNMPFELLKEKVIIPVQINGKTFRFLVDTGGIFEVSEKVRDEFGFPSVGSTTIVDINRREIEIESVVVPKVTLGKWSFTGRKAIVSDLMAKYPYNCFELDGMIGRDFFDDVILHFDLAKKTFRLTEDPTGIELNKDDRIKLKLSHRGLPNVRLKINGKPKYIEFDSGSGDFYSPKTKDVQKKYGGPKASDILKFQGKFSFGITMDGIEISNRYKEKIKSLELGDTAFNNFYSQFSKSSAPRIGAAILKYGAVTFDYQNGWCYFKPYGYNQHPEPFATFGFDVAIENGHYKVKWVLDGSDAQQKGLHPGCKIVMIDNQATENISDDCNGYLNGYSFKSKQDITVTFLNEQGVKKHIDLSSQSYG